MTHEAFHEVNKKMLSSIFQSLFPVKKKKQKYSRKKGNSVYMLFIALIFWQT